MPLPPLTLIGLAANQIALTISAALLLLVLWQSRQRTSLLFSAFLLAVIVNIATVMVFRLSPVFDFDPTFWMYADVNAIGAYGVLLFIFTSEFTGKDTRLARIGYLVGGVLWVISAWLTWTGCLITNVEVTPDGATRSSPIFPVKVAA